MVNPSKPPSILTQFSFEVFHQFFRQQRSTVTISIHWKVTEIEEHPNWRDAALLESVVKAP
jgi:hypothetical protein